MSEEERKVTAGEKALLRFLGAHGIVPADVLLRLEGTVVREGIRLPELLEREGIITEKDLAVKLSAALRIRLLDLSTFPLDPQITRTLKEAVASQYHVIPVALEGKVVEVVMANPLDQDALKAVEFNSGLRARPAVATHQEILDAFEHAYRLNDSLDQFLHHVPDESPLSITELQDDGGDLRSIAADSELPPVVKLADLIMIEGIKSGASDVHVQPSQEAVQVRYRIDGILEDSFRFPKWLQTALTGRLKVMGKLDITERRVPQDGRIQVRYQERIVDLRVSSLPTQHGEKMTFRILDSNRKAVALDQLGFNATDLRRMREAGRRPQGMILVTGPTGSGKTTSLYGLMREIHTPTINIVTIENPVEYQLKGISQVEVNEKQGLNFAGVLRSVLRQDPDVILVGEIRDKETALIAMQASQTGHLVLSTLHTNDSAATVTRLIDLGIDPFVVSSSLHLVVSQRLVRRVCQTCSAPDEPAEDDLRLLGLVPGEADFRRGRGCQVCRQSGYAGRVGIYEVMPIIPAIAKIIEAGGGESAIRQQAQAAGFVTLLEDAVHKVKAGLTSVEEVLRVVQVSEHTPRCPGCHKEVADEYTLCPHCGHVLQARCGDCGKHLNASWVTCPFCGGEAITGRRKGGAAPSPEGGEAETPPTPKRSFKALVVDDQPDIRHIVRLALERSDLGLTVVTAQDGPEALALADMERPDVVILDISMPGMDGFEVCRRLRSDLRTAFVPVLMLTAHDAPEFVTKGFGAGTDDFVTKPFKRDDLIARVRRMIDRTYGHGMGTPGQSPESTSAKSSSQANPFEPEGGDGWLH